MSGCSISIDILAKDLDTAKALAAELLADCPLNEASDCQQTEFADWRKRRETHPDLHPGAGCDLDEAEEPVAGVRITCELEEAWGGNPVDETLQVISVQNDEVTFVCGYAYHDIDDVGQTGAEVYRDGDVIDEESVWAADEREEFIRLAKVWTGFEVADA